jgi:hypothetical protein
MQESAAAKLPLLRGNCGDFNSNKRVKRQKKSSKRAIISLVMDTFLTDFVLQSQNE